MAAIASNSTKYPKIFYKYRPMNNQTLAMLVEDNIFYADPRTFNDPLDCRPVLEVDLEVNSLENVLRELLTKRLFESFSAAAKAFRRKGPNTDKYIEHLINQEILKEFDEIEYYSEDSDYGHDINVTKKRLLRSYIERELLKRYNRGIFSLAERSNCPLMWSHYGDQHRGLCIGYSVPDDIRHELHQVKYGGNRILLASTVKLMLEGDNDAARQVDEAVLLRKAPAWKYEKEWRLTGVQGLQNSYMELKEIIFGMRHDHAVRYTIFKALEQRNNSIQYYEITEKSKNFSLKKSRFFFDEICSHYPVNNRSLLNEFSPMEDDE